MPLSSPPGGHDWEAMQEPVSLACAQFSSPAAKVGSPAQRRVSSSSPRGYCRPREHAPVAAVKRLHAMRVPGAQATWKQWALTPHNVDVVVAVAWWVVAHVFRPDHPLSPAVKVGVTRTSHALRL